MEPIDYFAWFVFIVIIVTVVVIFVALAMLPGKIAKKHGHPQASAINWAGWLGLLLSAGVFWAVALVWANMRPVGDKALREDNERLRARLKALEAQTTEAEAN